MSALCFWCFIYLNANSVLSKVCFNDVFKEKDELGAGSISISYH